MVKLSLTTTHLASLIVHQSDGKIIKQIPRLLNIWRRCTVTISQSEHTTIIRFLFTTRKSKESVKSAKFSVKVMNRSLQRSTAETRWPQSALFLHKRDQTECWRVKRLKVLPFQPHTARGEVEEWPEHLDRASGNVKWNKRRKGGVLVLSYRWFIYRLKETQIYLSDSWIIHNHDEERVSKEKPKRSERQEWNRINIKTGWGTWNKTWRGPTSNASSSQLFCVQQRHILRGDLTSNSDVDLSNSCRGTRLFNNQSDNISRFTNMVLKCTTFYFRQRFKCIPDFCEYFYAGNHFWFWRVISQ